MFAYVFYTGMKDHNCLKNASLSFVIINLRKALKKPTCTQSLTKKWISISGLSVLSRSFILTARAQVGTGTYEVYQRQLPLCMPSTCCVFSFSCSCLIPAPLVRVHTPLLAMVWTCRSWCRLVPSLRRVPGTGMSDLKHFKLPRRFFRCI